MLTTDAAAPTPAQRRALIGAVGMAVAVRVAMLVAKWDRDLMLNDSFWYSAQATTLARGEGFADPFYGGPSAEHGPLTPLLLSLVSHGADPVPWQRAVMTVLGIAAVVVIALIAARLAGWWAGVAAAAVAAIYPNLWMNDSLVMSESLAVLLVSIALLVAIVALERGPGRRAWRMWLLGAVIGLAALTRSELALLAPLTAFVFWWVGRRDPTGDEALPRHRGGPVFVVVASLAVVAPWVAANLVRFERPVLMTTNDGTTLLGANCHDSYHGPDTGGWSLFCVLDAGLDRYEEPSVRAARHRDMAVDYALEHPGRLPVVAVARVARGLDLYGVPNLVAADVGEERDRWAAWAGIVAWWMLAVLAVVGARRVDRRHLAILAVPVVAVAVTTLAFYGGHRIRAPMEPVVAVLAGVAVASLLARDRGAAPACQEPSREAVHQ